MIKEFSQRAALNEGSTHRYRASVLDESGVAVLAAAVTDVRCTFTTAAGAVINSRTNQVVRNLNGGTVTDGVFALVLNGADTALQAGESATYVERRLTLVFTYNLTGGGTGTITHEVRYWIRSLAAVPMA